jgi:hypothetical protein
VVHQMPQPEANRLGTACHDPVLPAGRPGSGGDRPGASRTVSWVEHYPNAVQAGTRPGYPNC